MRAGISVNLHGDGHLTSIGARFETKKCHLLRGETAANLLHAVTEPNGALSSAVESAWRAYLPR